MQIDQINLRILLSTRKFFLFTIALGLIGFTLIMALLIPQGQEAFTTFNKLKTEEPKTESLRQKLASLESLTSTAEFAQIEVVDRALPSKKPLLELLMGISSVSQETGARISRFELAPGLVASDSSELQKISKGNTKSFDSLRVGLEVQGTFQQIQAFLLEVEQISPFTTVTEMEISGQLADVSQRDSSQIFRAKLTTETYFFTQAITVRVESPLPTIATPEQTVLNALAAFAPSDLPEQTEVIGGGLEDLFNLNKIETSEQLESLLQTRLDTSATPSPSPTTGLGTTTTGTGTVQGIFTDETVQE